ncbi:MAG: single-stranded-DNA-specific exonuclease RecJ [Candidatus Eiseniibacteriota bacterium]|nr:MAG: single-stranded-DNA-specific exonuclease RecJ [Candidatus Eisenbacteria bacterium]
MRPSEPSGQLVNELASSLSVPRAFAAILIGRGIDSTEKARGFLKPSISSLCDPFLLPDMEKAALRILQAVQRREKTLVFGDYDVDGITSVFLITSFLREWGGEVDYMIPHRLREGYGLSGRGVSSAKKMGASLIITVDNGITAFDEVAEANSEGIDVIVVDHHEPASRLPDAYAVIDPKRPDSNYPFADLAGVGVTYKLIQALVEAAGREAPRNLSEDLDVVALGTVADVVPLVEENRVLAKLGLEAIASSRKPGIEALKELSGLSGRKIQSEHIAFILAPRINAAGRMGDSDSGIRLLLSQDIDEARAIAEGLEDDNARRRQVDEETLQQALGKLEKTYGSELPAGIVLWSRKWHPGVLGIVASRLAEKFRRPTVLISVEGDTARGSCRSVEGFDVYDALSRCRNLLTGYGGHSHAAGIMLDKGDLDTFKDTFVSMVDESLRGIDVTPRLHLDYELHLSEMNERLAMLLEQLAPFGVGNPEPVFVTSGVQVLDRSVVGRGSHLKLSVKQGSFFADCIGFNLGYLEKEIACSEGDVSLAHIPWLSSWQGKSKLQLKLKDVKGQ